MIDQTHVVGVFGRRGSGKTTWARDFLKKQSRVVVFDPYKEYGFSAYTYRLSFGGLLQALDASQDTDRLSVIPELTYDAFEEFCEGVMDLKNSWIAFDEINLFTSSMKQHDAFDLLVRTSRRNNTSILVVSQRPVGIPPIVLSQANRLILYHLHSERDLAPLKDIVTPEDLDTIRILPPHQHLDISL